MRGFSFVRSENKLLARVLRRDMTSTERKLWHHLRNRKMGGAKFRRQQPFGPYVLDFYCAEHRLNIEVDGGQHDFPGKRAYDERRTDFLVDKGILTMRFWNGQVRDDIENVLNKIRDKLGLNSPSP